MTIRRRQYIHAPLFFVIYKNDTIFRFTHRFVFEMKITDLKRFRGTAKKWQMLNLKVWKFTTEREMRNKRKRSNQTKPNRKEILTSKFKSHQTHTCTHGGRMCPIVMCIFFFFLIGSQFCLMLLRLSRFLSRFFLPLFILILACLRFCCCCCCCPLRFIYRLKITNFFSWIYSNLKSERVRKKTTQKATQLKSHVCYGFRLWWLEHVCTVQICMSTTIYYKHAEYIQLYVGIYCVMLCVWNSDSIDYKIRL